MDVLAVVFGVGVVGCTVGITVDVDDSVVVCSRVVGSCVVDDSSILIFLA